MALDPTLAAALTARTKTQERYADRGEACEIGATRAASLVMWLHKNPGWIGSNKLAEALDSMADAPDGVRVGFLAYVERLIAVGGLRVNLRDDLAKVVATYTTRPAKVTRKPRTK